MTIENALTKYWNDPLKCCAFAPPEVNAGVVPDSLLNGAGSSISPEVCSMLPLLLVNMLRYWQCMTAPANCDWPTAVFPVPGNCAPRSKTRATWTFTITFEKAILYDND
jgi:hypothetical protein